ncbi:MAG: hypothetical protein A4E53_02866 [Pelotomaculum sp. PtaB.Bin104]|nr:MAG: hypothetical protein A4E53_02866 [Pelotomaculum sp. PtaB.Bin104]
MKQRIINVIKAIERFLIKIKLIRLYPILIIVLSLYLFSLSANHELIYKSQEEDPYKLLFSVLHEVGISLFILGSITILLELGDFREYFFRRLNDSLIRDEYICNLHPDKLKALENRIQKVLYFKDQPSNKDSFFYNVQNNVKPLIDGCYYDDYEIRIDCKIENDLIKKKITKRFEIINPVRDILYETVPINALMRNIDGIDDKYLYQLEMLLIKTITTTEQGSNCLAENITDDIKINYTRSIDEAIKEYNLKVYCEHKIEVEERCIVELTYNTITPLTDQHFTHRVGKPCKRYRCIFYLNPNENYDLTGYGFGFMDRNNTAFKNSFSSGIEIIFKDWILPGDGVIFTILKK